MNGEYGGNVPVGGADSQPQQTKADIRNILPLDLYEGMEYASLISSRLIFSRIGNNGELAIPPRDVKAFYRSFSKTYWFTRLIISDDLKVSIDAWTRKFAVNWKNANVLYAGVQLYVRFFDELATSGFITYFEGAIQPGFLLGQGMTPNEAIEVEKRIAELKQKGMM